MYNHREAALSSKKTDMLVGRNDVPRQGALPAPSASSDAPVQPVAFTPSSPPPAAPFGNAPTNGTAPPAQKRKRRTAAEIAADKAAEAAPAAAPVAPFRPAAEQPAPFATEQPTQFGISPGVAPNPELQATINNLFGKQ
jgi:hypothetical protein